MSKILSLALTVLTNPQSAAWSLRASSQTPGIRELDLTIYWGSSSHWALLENRLSFRSLVSFKITLVEPLLPAPHSQAPGPRARAGIQDQKRFRASFQALPTPLLCSNFSSNLTLQPTAPHTQVSSLLFFLLLPPDVLQPRRTPCPGNHGFWNSILTSGHWVLAQSHPSSDPGPYPTGYRVLLTSQWILQISSGMTFQKKKKSVILWYPYLKVWPGSLLPIK